MVKFILLAILVAAHASTVAFNESSVSSFAQTEEEQIEGIYPSDLNSYPTPDEPILDSSGQMLDVKTATEIPMNKFYPPYLDYLGPGLGGFPAMLFTQESTDCEAKCNQTTAVSETFVISNEAVHVLKGVLVTRIMPSFYIFLLLISMPLNALALVTFTCRIQAKKPAVIYMSHLACVDLLFTLLLPLKIHYHLNGSDWVFGEVACRVLSAAYYCYMYCSILLMMCMSVDRLVAVVFPIASLTWRSTRNATYACVLVWLLALAGTVPLLSIKQTLKIKNVGVTCHDAILHNDAGEQLYIYLFFILSCLYFFLPLAITLISYSIIIYVLSAKSDRLPKSSSSSSADNRRRAVIMTIAVLTEFVACFALTNGILLYHCFYLAKGSHSGEVVSSYAAYMLAVCAGSSSIFLDPLLYYYGSSQCRQQIRSVFWLKKTKRATEKLDTKTKSDKV